MEDYIFCCRCGELFYRWNGEPVIVNDTKNQVSYPGTICPECVAVLNHGKEN